MVHKCFYAFVGILTLALRIHPDTAFAADASVPFSSCGWSYQQPANPESASTVGFDDSGWHRGCAPFVKPWACLSPGSLILSDGVVVARRHFFNAGSDAVYGTYELRVKANGGVYINGREYSSIGSRNECTPGGLNVLTGIVGFQPGDNVVAVWNIASDMVSGGQPLQMGGQMDFQVTVSLPTATRRGAWGAVKAIYR